jgi:hypothetical protein
VKASHWIELGFGVAAACGIPLVILAFLMIGAFGVWRARRRAMAYAAVYAEPAPRTLTSVDLWAAGAWGLWSGAEDSAGWAADRAIQSLASWYGARDATALRGVIDGLIAGQTGNAAWDQVRAVDLARIGVAAGYLTAEESFDIVRRIATDLRAKYRTWEELGAAFEAGMHAWQDGRGITAEGERGRVQRNLPHLRSGVWPAIPFHQPL